MKMVLKGLERVKYYSTKNDREVDGVRFHVEYTDPNVTGLAVEGIYLSMKALENMRCVIPEDKYKDAIGSSLEVEYNRFGHVASLLVTK